MVPTIEPSQHNNQWVDPGVYTDGPPEEQRDQFLPSGWGHLQPAATHTNPRHTGFDIGDVPAQQYTWQRSHPEMIDPSGRQAAGNWPADQTLLSSCFGNSQADHGGSFGTSSGHPYGFDAVISASGAENTLADEDIDGEHAHSPYTEGLQAPDQISADTVTRAYVRQLWIPGPAGPMLNDAYTMPKGSIEILPEDEEAERLQIEYRPLGDGTTMSFAQAGSDSHPVTYATYSVTTNPAAIERVLDSWKTVFHSDPRFQDIFHNRPTAAMKKVLLDAQTAGEESLRKALEMYVRDGKSPFLVTASTSLVEARYRKKRLYFGWDFTNTAGAWVTSPEVGFELPLPIKKNNRPSRTLTRRTTEGAHNR